MRRAIILALLALSACGVRKELEQKPGTQPPPVARGAERAETPGEMTRFETQARPNRSGEPLDRSYERGDDYFDLPPS